MQGSYYSPFQAFGWCWGVACIEWVSAWRKIASLVLTLTLFPFHLPLKPRAWNRLGVSLRLSSYSSLICCPVNLSVVNLQDTIEVPWFVLLVVCIKNSEDFHLLHVDCKPELEQSIVKQICYPGANVHFHPGKRKLINSCNSYKANSKFSAVDFRSRSKRVFGILYSSAIY